MFFHNILYVKLERVADHFRTPLNFTNAGISPVIETGKKVLTIIEEAL
jgi:hypothetical protein